jgi:hypothetical protein
MNYNSFTIWLYIFLVIWLNISCDSNDPEPNPSDLITLNLISKGWHLDKNIFYFSDGREKEEHDSLSLTIYSLDSIPRSKVTFTDFWMVFDSIGSVSFANLTDYCSLPKDSTEEISCDLGFPFEHQSEWGFDMNDSLFVITQRFTGGQQTSRIEIINDDELVIKDTRIIEGIHPSLSDYYKYGDYPSGVLERIDQVYKSASSEEGPSWFHQWPDN